VGFGLEAIVRRFISSSRVRDELACTVQKALCTGRCLRVARECIVRDGGMILREEVEANMSLGWVGIQDMKRI
jgi:hypothetical protein